MKIALINPPTCDPTAPYIAIPVLTAFLRQHGIEVLPLDANVEAYDSMLDRSYLQGILDSIEQRLQTLEALPALAHHEQLQYLALQQAVSKAATALSQIEAAKEVLRDASGRKFFDLSEYASAAEVVDDALELIGAAYYPLQLSFLRYWTPFSMLSLDEIARDALPERNPFHDFFTRQLAPRLQAAAPDVIGISLVFPGQLQQAYALALLLRRQLPEAHLTAGGPALTQMMVRLSAEEQQRALGPFQTMTLFEGEKSLLALVRAIEKGSEPRGIIEGEPVDLESLPAPDFSGLPLHRYFSPQLVLPYDPTRGCYWGRCAFCHYGLARCGVAEYRERPVPSVVEHCREMQRLYGNRVVYFSHDSLLPATALKIAKEMQQSGAAIRWSSDMRPEASLTSSLCQAMRDGGALSIALGIESAAPRLLQLMNKGIDGAAMRAAVLNLSHAGIAVEAMCFTDFPTETVAEALATVRFIEELNRSIALFIDGPFSLVHGARIAQTPGEFGIKEMWQVAGDEFKSGLFYEERRPPKSDRQRGLVDEAIERVARGWRLNHYPWAGSLSTAHTLLYYEHGGPGVFRGSARRSSARRQPPARAIRRSPYDLETMARHAARHEIELWRRLVHEQRAVSRAAYEAMADKLPSMKKNSATKPQNSRLD